jgi:hypothetical protein
MPRGGHCSEGLPPIGSFDGLQELRSASQPLQRWQHERAALETELLLEFVDTELLRMPFPLQDTKGDYSYAHLKPSLSGTHRRSPPLGRLVIEATQPIHERPNVP